MVPVRPAAGRDRRARCLGSRAPGRQRDRSRTSRASGRAPGLGGFDRAIRGADRAESHGGTALMNADRRTSGPAIRAEAKLTCSSRRSMSPSAATERQLGDHYRWQGDFAKSASWYRRAQRNAPADTSFAAPCTCSIARSTARLLMPGELAGSDFGSGVSAISDNAGFGFYALRMSQAFSLVRPPWLRLAARCDRQQHDVTTGSRASSTRTASTWGYRGGLGIEVHREHSACSITAMTHRSFAVRCRLTVSLAARA